MELQRQNPVELKKALDSAMDRLLHLNQEKLSKGMDWGAVTEDSFVEWLSLTVCISAIRIMMQCDRLME